MAITQQVKRWVYPMLRRYAKRFPHHQCTRRGIRYEVDLRELIDFRISFGRGWEPSTRQFLEREVRPGHIVVEVGANVGSLTLEIARLVGPSGIVHAVEPTAGAFAKLERNASLNRELAARVRRHRLLMSDVEDSTANRDLRWSWRIDDAPITREEADAPAVPLDRLVTTAGIDRLDLLKIDVDGHETMVLRGATGTLRELKPTVLIELDEKSLAPQGSSVAEAIDVLERLGYRGYRLDGTSVRESAKGKGPQAHNAVFRPT